MFMIKQMNGKQWCMIGILIVCAFLSFMFVSNNYSFYDRPIAKITSAKVVQSTKVTDDYHNEDKQTTQELRAELKNTDKRGQEIHLKNTYTIAKAYDQAYQAGEEVFVHIDKDSLEKHQLTGDIKDVKRDKSILVFAWIFLFVLYLIGKRQGLFAFISLAVNVVLLTYAIEINVQTNMNLLFLCGVVAILFTVTSLLLVNGFNEKTYAAIVATLLGTLASLLITWLVMYFTKENGLHYEEMQFLTRPYKLVFIAGLFIGSLGAVMDVAITMSSSIFELWEKDHHISMKALKQSGLDIGRDIMGTMTSILFFAYISGTIPMLILYLKNGSPLAFTLSMNLSLELARALSGGLGIVLTIPIGLYISIFFVQRKKAKV
ncbi:MAG TPA: YibE/F family protein [Candidatus Avamphibacillus intestinigallinarum]|nr:YibE/F family protein [Candidatus Avamphibacillus intestinigallinarum]